MAMATAMSAGGQIAGGIQANRSAKFSSEQMDRNALAELAMGSRDAAEIRRQGDVMQSDARAAMAAGGGTTTDAGAIGTLGKLKQVSDYNALSALFGAQTKASSLRDAAKAKRYEGKAAQVAGIIGAATTALGAYPELSQK